MSNVTYIKPPPNKTAPRAKKIRHWAPRGMRAEDAATYLGISQNTFYRWVDEGLMPAPKHILRRGQKDGITLWDREAIDAAFDELDQSESGSGRRNSFDDD